MCAGFESGFDPPPAGPRVSQMNIVHLWRRLANCHWQFCHDLGGAYTLQPSLDPASTYLKHSFKSVSGLADCHWQSSPRMLGPEPSALPLVDFLRKSLVASPQLGEDKPHPGFRPCGLPLAVLTLGDTPSPLLHERIAQYSSLRPSPQGLTEVGALHVVFLAKCLRLPRLCGNVISSERSKTNTHFSKTFALRHPPQLARCLGLYIDQGAFACSHTRRKTPTGSQQRRSACETRAGATPRSQRDCRSAILAAPAYPARLRAACIVGIRASRRR